MQPVDEPLASRILGELLKEPDSLARSGCEDVRSDAADRDEASNLGRITYREIDADTATHRIADDVNGIEAHRFDKGDQCTLSGQHRVTAEVVADAETGEFHNQATEMLGERAEDAAEVPPAGDTGTRAVQEQQGRALARLVIAQDTRVGRQFTKRAVVGQFLCHYRSRR
jgi:hypothetical protein